MATIIENFEDQDLSPWSGDTGKISIDSNTVLEGSYSCQHQTDGFGKYFVESLPGDGLDYYPVRGDTILIPFYINSSNDIPVFSFGLQSSGGNYTASNGGYGLELRGDGTVEILKDGSQIGSGSVSYPDTNTWVYWEIDWGSDGTITVYLKKDSDGSSYGSFSFSDSSYDSGGIGFGHDNSDSQSTYNYYDYFRIPNTAPDAPTNPSPSDGATGVILN